MPDFRNVTSLDLPELQPYRTLRRPLEHQASGIFIGEGGKVVERMISGGIEIVSMLMTPQWQLRLQPRGDYPVYIAEQELLETIVGFPLHQGIMAIGRIPDQPPLDALLKRAAHPWLLVALDGLVHAENVGVVLRNASAFGVHAVLHDAGSSSPYLRRAVRNSMGTVFRMPIIQVPDLSVALLELNSKHGITVLGADPGGEVEIYHAEFHRDLCIVFGNEGTGISEGVLQACQQLVSIPMQNSTDSLNVASASAVFLHAVNVARRNL